MNPDDPTRARRSPETMTSGRPGATIQTARPSEAQYVETNGDGRVWNEADTNRRDRIRWGPVWAGLVVSVAAYLLFQLLLIALDIVDVRGGDSSDAVASALAALVAFFLGGVTAGASALWRGSDDGLLHGVVMWATGLVALVLLAGIGSGLALGAIDTRPTFDQFRSEQPAVDRQEANDDAKEAAGRASAGILAALVASAVGGVVGSRMWPKYRRDERLGRDTAFV
jgi:hypothetical protein